MIVKAIMACFIIATVFGGIALVINAFFGGIRGMRGKKGKMSKQEEKEETRIIQEIYQGLNSMESRVEALETILMDQKKKEREGAS